MQMKLVILLLKLRI